MQQQSNRSSQTGPLSVNFDLNNTTRNLDTRIRHHAALIALQHQFIRRSVGMPFTNSSH